MYKEYFLCSVLVFFIYYFWEYKGEIRNGLKFNILFYGCFDFVFIVGNVVDCIRNSLIMKFYYFYFFGLMNIFMELVVYINFIYIIGVCFCLCGFF